MKTVFIRALDAGVDEKAHALRQAISSIHGAATLSDKTSSAFVRTPESFGAIPGSPFAYWVTNGLLELFVGNPRFEVPGVDRAARQGGVTGDDFRWIRLWTEPEASSFAAESRPRNASLAKGGSYSLYYSGVHLVVRWDDARNTFWGFTGLPHRPSLQPASAGYYFRPGLTWPLRTQRAFGMREMPAGCVFGHKGPAAFIEGDSPLELLALLAVTTSSAFCYLVELQMAFGSYEVGVIQRTPVPKMSAADTESLASLAHRAWSLKRSLDTTNELSHAFLLPAGLNERITGMDPSAVDGELDATHRQINVAVYGVYGIGVDDRAAIEAWSVRSATSDASDDAEGEDDEGGSADATQAEVGDAVHSWLVGVAFGRFDPRLATGERPIPPEPEPFAALPSRSPGMYPEGEEPADRSDILVDDEGHTDDLTARAMAIAERVRVDVPENLRGWLATEFFPLHIKMYSKSRRKAPIYWQLATSSASYSVWLYIHAFSKDTLFRVQNDYVAPKLAHEERRFESLTRELRDGSTAVQRKTLAAQEALVEELRAFLEEVKRVAPLWNPNLDDGVVINFAPLWRVVPQNRSWQKELKSTWDALCNGKYDWAQLAMHFWPERVVPKCAKDRSLAIAHGLEDAFWGEGSDGKWTPRNTPGRSIDEFVRERTSPAVKAALKRLLEAPTATGNGRGGARRRRRAEEGGSR